MTRIYKICYQTNPRLLKKVLLPTSVFLSFYDSQQLVDNLACCSWPFYKMTLGNQVMHNRLLFLIDNITSLIPKMVPSPEQQLLIRELNDQLEN